MTYQGTQSIDSVVQPTQFANLSFIASRQQLENLGRQITDREEYARVFTGLMGSVSLASVFPTRSPGTARSAATVLGPTRSFSTP